MKTLSPRPFSPRIRPSRLLSPRGLGLGVEVAGVMAVASALLPAWRQRLPVLDGLVGSVLNPVASGVAAVAGVGLIMVGRGVARRRRLAWLLAVVLLVVAAAALAVKGTSPALAIMAGLAAVALVGLRAQFVVRPAPDLASRVVRLAVVAVVLDVVYGVAMLAIYARYVRPRFAPGPAVHYVAAGLVGVSGPLSLDGRFGHWFPHSLAAAGMLTIIVVATVAFAPVALHGWGPPDDLTTARSLLDRADGDTLDPFVLRADKRRLYSPDRRAVIGFRYVYGVGLATGDPVGDPAAFDAVIRAFVGYCHQLGWRPAAYGARGDSRERYENHGLQAMYVGDEAIVDVDRFSLTGRHMRNARQAVTRTMNAGITTDMCREGELDPTLHGQLVDIAQSQHADAREFGFSMALGRLLSGDHPDCLIAVARDQDGRPVAFQRYVTCRQGQALSLDTMRRSHEAPNGVNERLIVDTIGWAQQAGAAEVSLNFAAFRRIFDEDGGRTRSQAAQAWLLRGLDGRFGVQMDSLRRFNDKFDPRWVPRYIIYRSPADLPAVGLAALSAEGFLPFDPNREGHRSGRQLSAVASS